MQRNLLVDDTNLFVVEDSVLNIVPVNVLHRSNKTIVVSGLVDGMKVVSKPVPGGYAGMVVIDNETEQ